ncbi:hypothetical protein AYI70_g118 [Smittium culicis]|uniref:Uncharacterized protein n=1 Tax=Smittium culicis TaxID=133412 RepID=A0A1R1YHX6_9FUNG|nr:hypothetical protein AYI70_g118 [Smittium culicis]
MKDKKMSHQKDMRNFLPFKDEITQRIIDAPAPLSSREVLLSRPNLTNELIMDIQKLGRQRGNRMLLANNIEDKNNDIQ